MPKEHKKLEIVEETKMSKELKELLKCSECGKSLIPDKKAVISGTKKWDRHTYKPDCDCLKNKGQENIRISVG